MSIDPKIRDFVERRASGKCEYCRLPEFAEPYAYFHVEHIHARQHGGDDSPENLAWACPRCNMFKGTNIASLDPRTSIVVELFNPRRHQWQDHFALHQGRIVGNTPTGRATVRLLKMNHQARLDLRRWLILHNLFN